MKTVTGIAAIFRVLDGNAAKPAQTKQETVDFVPFKCLSFNHLGHRNLKTKVTKLLLGLYAFVGSEKVLVLFLWSLSMKTN